MRRATLALGALLFAAAALAQEPGVAPLRLEHKLCQSGVHACDGDTFDYPRVQVQQQIFGIANGIALLAAACRTGAAAETSRGAYTAWRTRQARAIAQAMADLSAIYFGDGTAHWQALVETLNLKEALDFRPDSAALVAACATLPQALAQPRYDLAARFGREELMARIAVGAAIDTHERLCSQELIGAARAEHAARFARWRAANAPLLLQAAEALARDWPGDAPAASFADWLTHLNDALQRNAGHTDCRAYSESLDRPEAALRNAFRLPPTHVKANR